MTDLGGLKMADLDDLIKRREELKALMREIGSLRLQIGRETSALKKGEHWSEIEELGKVRRETSDARKEIKAELRQIEAEIAKAKAKSAGSIPARWAELRKALD